jgi:4-oxalocrotonate tautomerase
MPHVIVKLYSGRSQDEKARLASAITEAVTTTLGCGEASVSVAIADVSPSDWAQKVYRADILESAAELFKRPGYDPFA